MFDLDFTFSGKMWLWQAEKGSWHFISIPKEYGDQIKMFQPRRVGFGSVRVTVKIGGSEWETSVFPSKDTGSYILPVKAAIRKKEKIGIDDQIDVMIKVKSNL